MYNFKNVEEEVSKNWVKNKELIKKTLKYDKNKKLFSFLEGPPTANAPPGLHHMEVRVFKDLVCRFKHMQGFTVPRKGGWDCHGLPVEVQVEKELKLNSKKEVLNYGIGKFINKCRDSVFSCIKDWNRFTEKTAYWIDLENPYVTLDNDYIESVWWSLKELYNKGLLYEGHKVVPLCPRCETPLSSHEVALGYKDITEPSVVVKFQVKNKNRYFLVWTTTEWTLISNLALAVNPKIEYSVVREGNEEYILAKDLVNKHFENAKIIESFKGEKLVGLEYEPIFDYFKLDKKAWFVIKADFVTVDEGTGIVHMAPAFGEEDYEAGKKNNLPFLNPVLENGKFNDEVEDFKGMFVKDAGKEIIDWLERKGYLFKEEKYTHSYPFCWRCETPLIYYAMNSWFINVTKLKDKMIKLNKNINWYPNTIKEGRFGDWLENLKDWALSRKKFWGTPLPIWRCGCGEEEAIGSIRELKEKSGFKSEIDLHRPLVDSIKLKCKCGKEMSRVADVIDCWYDSGSATFAQFHYPFENKEMFEKAFPYDFIAEAIDQTRGWFYTLHAIAVMLFGKAAYKNVVCAGHIVDEKGEKMSKSKGNVLDPWEVFDFVGVDAVRLQFCMTEPGDQKRFGVHLVNETVLPFLNILWNCYLYLKVNNKKVGKVKLEREDEWIISRVNSLVSDITAELEVNNYHHCTSKLIGFVNEDLSRWYIKLVRDRSEEDAVVYTLGYVFDKLVRVIAPFAPYISDFIYLDLVKKEKSVHFDKWPSVEKVDKKLEEKMDKVREVVTELLKEREKSGYGVRWPLRKAVITLNEDVKDLVDVVKNQVNVKEVEIKKGDFSVWLDMKIDDGLEREGYAREVIRRIQALRKKAGLKKENRIKAFINSKYDLKKLEKDIKEKIGADVLEFNKDKKMKHGEEVKIKDYEFEVGLDVV